MPPNPPLPGREGLGVGAAKALGGSSHDCFEDSVRIVVEVIIPDTKNGPALLSKELVAPPILVGSCMLPAVQFDYELGPPTGEIGIVWSDWQLSCKLWPHAGQNSPKLSLMVGGVLPKRTGALCSIIFDPAAHLFGT
jgi:hypothetical protein